MSEQESTKIKLAQALKQACQTQPFAQIKIQTLTEIAGINRQTFYYHFKNSEELFNWIYLNEALVHLRIDSLSLDNWEEQALKMLKVIQNDGLFYQNVLRTDHQLFSKGFIQTVQPAFIRLFQQMDRNQELSPEDMQFYSLFFSYGCTGMLETWIRESFPQSAFEMAVQLYRLATDIEFFSYNRYREKE